MAKAKKRGLSKGLEQIFGEDINILDEIQEGRNDTYVNGKKEIPTASIRSNPYQPRKEFDEVKLAELAESIREHGVFTPILVKEANNGYELIAGERRLRASILAQKDMIPAIIVDFDDKQMMEIALLENVQREDLNPIEEAIGYQKLIERLNYTQEEVAKRIGKSRVYVTNLLRLLQLPTKIQDMVAKGELSYGHAKCLLPLKDESLMLEFARKAVKEQMNVRALEKAVKRYLEGEPTRIDPKVKGAQVIAVEERLTRRFQSKVDIEPKKIIIHYDGDTNELNRLLELLGGLDEEL